MVSHYNIISTFILQNKIVNRVYLIIFLQTGMYEISYNHRRNGSPNVGVAEISENIIDYILL
jgi:hypothetical protein